LDVIPVIDLQGGAVVRAQKGERHLYTPIETPLAPTSRPADVVAGFLALHEFRTIYIADLDAIEGKGHHSATISALEDAFPQVDFWVDCGIGTCAQACIWLAAHRGALVFGSESLRDAGLMAGMAQRLRSILSLDFRGEEFQGPLQLAEDDSLWPARLIVMTLARIGSHAGPDFDRLRDVQAKSAGRHAIYAAGGVRDQEDLRILEKAGMAGVLVASALHDGRIGPQHLGIRP
jgi:phosphoribosylformimino-5-aminoimidazole carboxamide ribotide isomerase